MKSLALTISLVTISNAFASPQDDTVADGNTGGDVPTGVTASSLNPTDLPPGPTQTGCPTVSVTGELCTTCPIPACLGLATATQRCGCPESIPTVTLDFPCEDNCEGAFCSTSWSYETETCGGPGGTSEPVPTATGGGNDGNGEGNGDGDAPPATPGPSTVSANVGYKLAPFWAALI